MRGVYTYKYQIQGPRAILKRPLLMEAVIMTIWTSLIPSSVNKLLIVDPKTRYRYICLMNLILLKLEIEMQNLNIIQRNHSLCIQDADLGFDQIIFCVGDPGVSYIGYLQIICVVLIMCPMTKMGFKFATLGIWRVCSQIMCVSNSWSCVKKLFLVELSQPRSSVVRASAWKAERCQVQFLARAHPFRLDMIIHCTRNDHWKGHGQLAS